MSLLVVPIDVLVLKTLQSLPIALAMPWLHWLLIQANLSSFFAAFPILAYIVIVPLLRAEATMTLHPVLCCTWLYIFLRLADASLLDRDLLTKLSFYEYVEYIGAFRLPHRLTNPKGGKGFKLTTEKKKVSALDVLSVPYVKVISHEYVGKVFLDAGLKGLFSYFAISHILTTRKDWSPPVFSIVTFQDLPLARDYLLIGFSIMFALDIGINIGNHCLALFFKVPFVPIMNAPYLATSIRDFWVR